MHRISFTSDRSRPGSDAAGRIAALEPGRTAQLVVDLQNGFMVPGAPVEVPEAREIVGNVNRIAAAIRAAGGTNAFLRMDLSTRPATSWREDLGRRTPDERAAIIDAFSPGAATFELWPGLEVEDGDLVVEKNRFSAFVPGASHLHDELAARGVDTLVVTGTLTNVCCESTARDAMQMDYRVLFVADATAARTDEAHNASLANIDAHFGQVVTTDDVVTALAAAAGAGAGAGALADH